MRILQFFQFLRTFSTESIELGSGYNEVNRKIAKTIIKCPEVMIFQLRSHRTKNFSSTLAERSRSENVQTGPLSALFVNSGVQEKAIR